MTTVGVGMARLAIMVAASSLLGCSSGTSGTSGGPAGSSGASGSVPPASGSTPGRTALLGTWDVISAIGGVERTATITVGVATLSLEWERFTMNADVSGDVPNVTASFEGVSGPITATHLDEAADFGQLPYRVGGSWNVRGRDADQCTGTVKADSASFSCSNLAPPLIDVFQGYDYLAKKPIGTGTSTAQRKSKGDSMFGELGGEWTVVSPRATCSLTFEGNRLRADCRQQRGISIYREGTLTLTFEDGVVSGTSNAGEVSSRRR